MYRTIIFLLLINVLCSTYICTFPKPRIILPLPLGNLFLMQQNAYYFGGYTSVINWLGWSIRDQCIASIAVDRSSIQFVSNKIAAAAAAAVFSTGSKYHSLGTYDPSALLRATNRKGEIETFQ